MLLNRSLNLLVSIRRIMPNFEKLFRNQEIIAKELNSLRAEVHDLENLFRQVKNWSGDKSGSSLLEENEYLEKQINLTKQELIRLEVARGVQQIDLPERTTIKEAVVSNVTSTQQVSNVTSTQQPVESQKTKVNVKESKTKEKSDKQQDSKKEKQDSKKGGDVAKEGPVDVSRLDLRIGKIVDVKKHPDADSLYVEQIDVGKDKHITVVSGLVKHISIEDMQGRMVILLCNLKPAKMRGITSEAMVMCASTPDKVEVLEPPHGSSPGDIVHVDGYPPNPDSVLNPKKKIFETVAPDLKTDSSLKATYKGHVWTVPGKGCVTAPSLAGVNIK